ncbi:chromatin remodeling protein [Plasmodium gaboni]|uniref:Chromatin remodeling protein n=1 Tax=Plasmodium gaboni TaxID=647221 RepID=A0A151LIG2_9APIC|nr:chromatin remodeling protein [Plasmodium gaboni]KYN98686.1 chromatin remodeling protein [Plasmodium gaboni]
MFRNVRDYFKSNNDVNEENKNDVGSVNNDENNENYDKESNDFVQRDFNNDINNKDKDCEGFNLNKLSASSNDIIQDGNNMNENLINRKLNSYSEEANDNDKHITHDDKRKSYLNNKEENFEQMNEHMKKRKLNDMSYINNEEDGFMNKKDSYMEMNDNEKGSTNISANNDNNNNNNNNNNDTYNNDTHNNDTFNNNDNSEEKPNYLQEKLEQLLAQTKRYTEKLAGQRLKMNAQMKSSKKGRCLLTEKEEDFMLLKDANEEDEAIILKQPMNINGTMKPYQLEGLNWLYQLYRFKINGILADEMGLGKTLQTISLLCYLRFNKNIKKKSIIICPRSTLDNWYEEIKKWCTPMKAFKYYGNKDQRKELNRTLLHSDFDVLLTTYEIVIKDKSALYDIDWFFLVIDEAHRIKNEKSVLSSSVRFLRSENRLLITGTPLHNNLKELWSLLNFLMPKIFDNSEEFDNLFNISKISTNDNKQSEIITQLHTILKPFMLRRLKVEVEQSLPPKREIYIFVGMSKLQKKLYSDILSKNIDVLNAMTGSKNQMLNILMQLRKCCNHPYLFDGIEEPPYIEGNHLIETSGKMSLLDKLLPRLKKENSRVLLFSQMTRLLDIIDDYCRWKNYPYLRIDGSTPGDERQIRINQFNEPNSKYFIFLLSTRAGGIGINLTTADIVILFDSDYNPQMDIQAMDRAHRIGQKKRVIVYRFVTQNSVEEKIVERAAKKLKLDSLIIQKGKLNLNSAKENNKQELHDILNFGAPEVYKTQDISSISDEDIDIILADAEKRTIEIEKKLKNLENIFDLSNISLDGGLNMYNNLEKEPSEESTDEEDSSGSGDEAVDGASADDDVEENGVKKKKKKKKNISKIRKTIKKFLKNNKKNMTFLDLGERKSKWKVINTTCGRVNKKKMVLHGWRAEARGGHDFQFFNVEKLDELEKIEDKWNNYMMNQEKINVLIEAQNEEKDYEKIVTFNEFLDKHAKNIYQIITLINPSIFDEYKNIKEEELSKIGTQSDVNSNDKDYKKSSFMSTDYNMKGTYINNINSINNNNNNITTSISSIDDQQYFKKKIMSLFESGKKLQMIKFKDRNVKNCYIQVTNYIKKNFPEKVDNNNNKSTTLKNKKLKKGKQTKNINVECDIASVDIEKIKMQKQELMKQGFSKWNKAEFNKLMSGLIIYGTNEVEYIYEKYFSNSKKSMDDIKAYLSVFFRKYDQIKGGIRLFDKIRRSDLQKKIIEEENNMITEFVEKQLSEGVDSIEKLQLPSNLRYDFIEKREVLNITEEVKTENETNVLKDEEIAYYNRENKILLWLLYQQGVVHIKNIHILTPYYWPEAYNFFKYATTPFENVEYRCRLIVDAIAELYAKKESIPLNNKDKRRI